MESMQQRDTLIEFPCNFPIKVLGSAADDFDALVVSIVRKQFPDLREGAVSSKESRQGRYISITVTVQADSQEQLDRLYAELGAHEKILMVL